MFRRANWQIVTEESTVECLVIRDLGPWDEFLSVTNAAEQVVEELRSLGELPDGRVLEYYDSDGHRDRILVERGLFAGIALLG
jgi:hypothetical protein